VIQAHARSEPSHRLEIAASLMAEFAERTALSSDAPPCRYLWTDAFAVENELRVCMARAEAGSRAARA